MLDMAAFGGRLRTLRCSRGLTQRDMATAIRVSEQAVSKWEHGAVLPDAEHLLLLGRVLRVSVDALLGADADEPVLRTIRVGGACFELVWRPLEARAYGYVHEVAMAEQPEGVQVYRMPELLYLRARNDAAAQLLAKECCGL